MYNNASATAVTVGGLDSAAAQKAPGGKGGIGTNISLNGIAQNSGDGGSADCRIAARQGSIGCQKNDGAVQIRDHADGVIGIHVCVITDGRGGIAATHIYLDITGHGNAVCCDTAGNAQEDGLLVAQGTDLNTAASGDSLGIVAQRSHILPSEYADENSSANRRIIAAGQRSCRQHIDQLGLAVRKYGDIVLGGELCVVTHRGDRLCVGDQDTDGTGAGHCCGGRRNGCQQADQQFLIIGLDQDRTVFADEGGVITHGSLCSGLGNGNGDGTAGCHSAGAAVLQRNTQGAQHHAGFVIRLDGHILIGLDQCVVTDHCLGLVLSHDHIQTAADGSLGLVTAESGRRGHDPEVILGRGQHIQLALHNGDTGVAGAFSTVADGGGHGIFCNNGGNVHTNTGGGGGSGNGTADEAGIGLALCLDGQILLGNGKVGTVADGSFGLAGIEEHCYGASHCGLAAVTGSCALFPGAAAHNSTGNGHGEIVHRANDAGLLKRIHQVRGLDIGIDLVAVIGLLMDHEHTLAAIGLIIVILLSLGDHGNDIGGIPGGIVIVCINSQLGSDNIQRLSGNGDIILDLREDLVLTVEQSEGSAHTGSGTAGNGSRQGCCVQLGLVIGVQIDIAVFSLEDSTVRNGDAGLTLSDQDRQSTGHGGIAAGTGSRAGNCQSAVLAGINAVQILLQLGIGTDAAFGGDDLAAHDDIGLVGVDRDGNAYTNRVGIVPGGDCGTGGNGGKVAVGGDLRIHSGGLKSTFDPDQSLVLGHICGGCRCDLNRLLLLGIGIHAGTVHAVGNGVAGSGIGRARNGVAQTCALIRRLICRRRLCILGFQQIGGKRILVVLRLVLALVTKTVIDLGVGGVIGVHGRIGLSSLELIGIALDIGAHGQSQCIGIVIVGGLCDQLSLAGNGAITQEGGRDFALGQVQCHSRTNGSGFAHGIAAGIGLGIAGLGCVNEQVDLFVIHIGGNGIAAGKNDLGQCVNIGMDIIVDQAHGDGSIDCDILSGGIGDHNTVLVGGVGSLAAGNGVGTGNTDGIEIIALDGTDIQGLGSDFKALANTGIHSHLRKGHGSGSTHAYGLAGGIGIVGCVAGGNYSPGAGGSAGRCAVVGACGALSSDLVLIHTALGIQGGAGGSVDSLGAFGGDHDIAFRDIEDTVFLVGDDGLGLGLHNSQSQRTGHANIGGTYTGNSRGGDPAADTIQFVIAAQGSGDSQGGSVDDRLALLLVLDIDHDLINDADPVFAGKDILNGHALAQVIHNKGDGGIDDILILLRSGSSHILALDSSFNAAVDDANDLFHVVIGNGHANGFAEVIGKSIRCFCLALGDGDDPVDKYLDGKDFQDLIIEFLQQLLQIVLGVAFHDIRLDGQALAFQMGGTNIGDIFIAHDVDGNTDTHTGGGIGGGGIGGDNTVGIVLALDQDVTFGDHGDAVSHAGSGVVLLDVEDHGRRDLHAAFTGLGALAVGGQVVHAGGVNIIGACKTCHAGSCLGILICDCVCLALAEEVLHGIRIVIIRCTRGRVRVGFFAGLGAAASRTAGGAAGIAAGGAACGAGAGLGAGCTGSTGLAGSSKPTGGAGLHIDLAAGSDAAAQIGAGAVVEDVHDEGAAHADSAAYCGCVCIDLAGNGIGSSDDNVILKSKDGIHTVAGGCLHIDAGDIQGQNGDHGSAAGGAGLGDHLLGATVGSTDVHAAQECVFAGHSQDHIVRDHSNTVQTDDTHGHTGTDAHGVILAALGIGSGGLAAGSAGGRCCGGSGSNAACVSHGGEVAAGDSGLDGDIRTLGENNLYQVAIVLADLSLVIRRNDVDGEGACQTQVCGGEAGLGNGRGGSGSGLGSHIQASDLNGADLSDGDLAVFANGTGAAVPDVSIVVVVHNGNDCADTESSGGITDGALGLVLVGGDIPGQNCTVIHSCSGRNGDLTGIGKGSLVPNDVLNINRSGAIEAQSILLDILLSGTGGYTGHIDDQSQGLADHQRIGLVGCGAVGDIGGGAVIVIDNGLGAVSCSAVDLSQTGDAAGGMDGQAGGTSAEGDGNLDITLDIELGDIVDQVALCIGGDAGIALSGIGGSHAGGIGHGVGDGGIIAVIGLDLHIKGFALVNIVGRTGGVGRIGDHEGAALGVRIGGSHRQVLGSEGSTHSVGAAGEPGLTGSQGVDSVAVAAGCGEGFIDLNIDLLTLAACLCVGCGNGDEVLGHSGGSGAGGLTLELEAGQCPNLEVNGIKCLGGTGDHHGAVGHNGNGHNAIGTAGHGGILGAAVQTAGSTGGAGAGALDGRTVAQGLSDHGAGCPDTQCAACLKDTGGIDIGLAVFGSPADVRLCEIVL